MASYLRDARTVFLANAASAMAGLLTQAVLAWFLLPAGRGEFAACILFATLLTLAFALGQEMANVYFVGSKQITPSEAFSQSLFAAVFTSGLACLVGFALTQTDLSFLDKAPRELFRWSLLCIPAAIFHLYLSRILLGLSAMGQFTFVTAAPAILEAVGILVAARAGLDVKTALLLQAATNAAGAILAAFLLVNRHGCRLVSLHWSQLLRSIGYGARFYLGKLCSMANVQLGSIILAFAAVERSELGLFAAASAMASRLWMVSESLQVAMLPRSAADPAGQSRLIAQVTRLCLALSLAITVLVLLFSRPLIALILSPRFLPVLLPFQLLLPGVVIRVIPKILVAYFNGINRPGINSWAMGITAALNIGLMVLLLPRWGLSGVAVSMSTAYALEAAILGVAFCRLSGVRAAELLLPERNDWEAIRRTLRGNS